MSKWLVIENAGLLNEIDITSLGLSSKRSDSNKIGQFGSGWKYALAWLVRNNVPMEIYSGENKINIDTETILHKNEPVSFIMVNGRKTDITTGFGELDWEAWMAIRELVSNAIDEGEFKLTTHSEVQIKSEKTVINLEMTPEITAIMTNYHHYFCFDRIPSYENSHGKLFLKQDSSKISIYRKGIRCYGDTDIESAIDVDFNNILINESRLTNIGLIDSVMRKLLNHTDVPVNIWEALFLTVYKDWLPYTIPQSAVEAIKVLNSKYNIQCPINLSLLGIIGSGLLDNSLPLMVIPNKYYDACVAEGIFRLPENIERVGDVAFIEIEDARGQLIEYYLKNFGYPVKVRIGTMDYSREVLIQNNLVLIKKNSLHNALELATMIIQTVPIESAKNIFQQYFE